jgi:DNA-binding transcriptional MerR regulator
LPPTAEGPVRSYTIRQLSLEFGVTARALRFYEDRGLLRPERRGQARIYSARDRARLQLILRGKRVGFSLTEIGDLLDLYDKDDQHAVQMAASVAQFRRRITALEAQKIDIELSIADLRAACDALETRLGQVRPDLLPRAGDYDQVLRKGLEPHDHP